MQRTRHVIGITFVAAVNVALHAAVLLLLLLACADA